MSVLELHLVNISIFVAYNGGKYVVRKIGCLDQRDKLRAQLTHTLLQSDLYGSVGTRG